MAETSIELGPVTRSILERITYALEGRPAEFKETLSIEETTDQAPRWFTEAIAGLEARIENAVRQQHRIPFEKALYSVKEVSERTKEDGVKAYKPYTIRQACNLGRIPDARKTDWGGHWLIPHTALLRILSEGLPATQTKQ